MRLSLAVVCVAAVSAACASTARQWQGPVFFAWGGLTFSVLQPRHVLVTGGFRWLQAGSADTSRYVYLSILDATPSGLKIRVEHETERPRS